MKRIFGAKQTLVLLSISVFYLLAGGGINTNPLSPLHRDVAIYLMDAKLEVSVGSLLKRVDWVEVEKRLQQKKKPRFYRRLARYGNIFLLSLVYRLYDGDMSAIIAAKALYSSLVLLFFIYLYFFLNENAKLALGMDESQSYDHNLTALGVVLFFIASRLTNYLNGNLVSEVPCLLAITSSCYYFLISVRRHNVIYSIIAGILLFFAYLCRLESVLVPLSYVFFLGAFFYRHRLHKEFLLYFCQFLLTMVLCWSAYRIYLGPIANPYNFILSALAVSQYYPSPISVSIQNFLSTVGWMCLLSLIGISTLKSRLTLAAWCWFLVMFFPFAVMFIKGAGLDARFFSILLPPLSLCCLATSIWLSNIFTTIFHKKRQLGHILSTLIISLTGLLLYSDTLTRFININNYQMFDISETEKKIFPMSNLQKINGKLNAQGLSSSAQLFLKKGWDLKSLMVYFDKLHKEQTNWSGNTGNVFLILEKRDITGSDNLAQVKKYLHEKLNLPKEKKLYFSIWNPDDEIILLKFRQNNI